MKKLFFLLIAIQITIVGQVYWNAPGIVGNTSVNSSDKIESYTNSAGNHIAINSNGTLRYYLINTSGQKIRENLNLDNGCEYSNYTVAITGYENDVYIVYQKANKIKILKSTNAGANWSNSIEERTIANNNCNGVDAIYDSRGLHVAWAVKIGNNFETYYERYRSSVPFIWEGYKEVTDFDANDIGGRPSLTTSENKVHVAYNMNTSEEIITISGPAKTRDFNFLTSTWEAPQWIEIEPSRIPPPYPGAEIDFTCSNIERITYGGSYLHLINHQLIAVEYTVFHYLYYKRRAVNSSNWETEILVSKEIVFPQRLVKPLFTPNERVNILCLKGEVAEYKHYYLLNNVKYGPYSISNIGIGAGFCFSSNSNDLYAYWLSHNPSFLYWSKYDSAPLAPLNPQLSANPGDGMVRFSWQKNNEADVSVYEVWRKVNELGGVWQLILTTSNNYFVDPTYYYAPGAGNFGLTYRVRARDFGNHLSDYSSEVSTRGEEMGKQNVTNYSQLNFSLNQNYPNPFNPRTKILYSVKEEGLVMLKVYDVLGKEIVILVNESKPAGNYEAEFNASQLPSGMYIYKIQAGQFSDAKKMILTK
jgi:hypothetical protein